MKIYSDPSEPILIVVDLRRACLIHESILKNPLTTIITYESRRKKTSWVINLADHNVREDEILQDDELSMSSRTNKKALRPIPNGEFEAIQINDNMA